jgi:hypothetical protein
MPGVAVGAVMGWGPLAIAALFLVPLWATGELGVYSFEEPRSHLVWDEAMGAEVPRPVDEPGGTAMLAAQLAAGTLVALVVVAWARRST